MKLIKYSRTSKINMGDFAISECIEYLENERTGGSIQSYDLLHEDFNISDRISTTTAETPFYKVKRRGKLKSYLVLSAKKLLFFVKEKRAFKNQIEKSEAVILGGGNIFSEYNGSDLFFRSYQIFKLAKSLGKKVYVYGVGIGLFEFEYKKRLKDMIDGSSGFYVRDITSSEYCSKAVGTIKGGVKVSLDPAFVVSDMYPKKKADQKYIGANFMNFSTIVDGSNFQLTKVAENLKKLSAQFELPIKIINTSYGEDLSISLEMSRILDSKKVSHTICNIQSLDQLPEIFSDLSFFIASRMHSSIFAMSYEVPTLIYPWHHKVIGLATYLFEEKGTDILLDDENFNVDEVLDKIRNYRKDIDLKPIILKHKKQIYADYAELFQK
ncbi:polysaccharide pyruvyl transferase family protein [Luteirhabdus pelagi]|uniref:polysaccharide pyruvyl transferase family protein n=1 Tax=Luteirhabdus pelagi TaxID=2792783 RepID=UPI001939E612|nr:polysaccharide pyruvyl transferase family protein [Luteirhabdus pelagi]